jgi:hypothetical protein
VFFAVLQAVAITLIPAKKADGTPDEDFILFNIFCS